MFISAWTTYAFAKCSACSEETSADQERTYCCIKNQERDWYDDSVYDVVGPHPTEAVTTIEEPRQHQKQYRTCERQHLIAFYVTHNKNFMQFVNENEDQLF